MAGMAIVMSSALQRGIFTAIHLMVRQPQHVRAFASPGEAGWGCARGRARAAGDGFRAVAFLARRRSERIISLGEGSTSATDPLESVDDSIDKAGCSIVQFCRHPGDDGTRCVASSACSCDDARTECAREAVNVCGRPRRPFLIVGGQCG
jgi:hypothetical protein